MTAKMTLSRSSKISIPKDLRERQNWRVGQQFAFVPDRAGGRLVPVPTLDELSRLFEGADPTNYRDREDRY